MYGTLMAWESNHFFLQNEVVWFLDSLSSLRTHLLYPFLISFPLLTVLRSATSPTTWPPIRDAGRFCRPSGTSRWRPRQAAAPRRSPPPRKHPRRRSGFPPSARSSGSRKPSCPVLAQPGTPHPQWVVNLVTKGGPGAMNGWPLAEPPKVAESPEILQKFIF